jgi:hypothetical protein
MGFLLIFRRFCLIFRGLGGVDFELDVEHFYLFF